MSAATHLTEKGNPFVLPGIVIQHDADEPLPADAGPATALVEQGVASVRADAERSAALARPSELGRRFAGSVRWRSQRTPMVPYERVGVVRAPWRLRRPGAR